jgi:hypothetical protein
MMKVEKLGLGPVPGGAWRMVGSGLKNFWPSKWSEMG